MAEGFDDLEMKDIDTGELESYTDDQLVNSYESLVLKMDKLLKRGGNRGPVDIKVRYDTISGTLDAIEHERELRIEKLMAKADSKGKHSIKITKYSFIDSGDEEKVVINGVVETPAVKFAPSDGVEFGGIDSRLRNTLGKSEHDDAAAIKKLGDPIEAPSRSILTTLKRNITSDKKGNIERVLGMDHQFRVRDGKASKGLLRNSRIVFNSKDKVIGLSYKGERVYVSGDGGKSFRKTTNKKNQESLREFEAVIEKATEEYNKFEEEKKNYPLVDTTPKTGDVYGLTVKENSELRGVLAPSESVDPETRPKFLKIQADHLQETIDKTKEISESNPLESSELNERVTGLEKARDLTLEQLEIEEIREAQEDDISRLIRFKDWAKKNIAELSSLLSVVVSIAGIITTVMVSARKLVAKGAQATSKFAKAVYKTFKSIAKGLGPILGPILTTIGSLLATLLRYGAEGIAWLASNLWALMVAIAFLVYSGYWKK